MAAKTKAEKRSSRSNTEKTRGGARPSRDKGSVQQSDEHGGIQQAVGNLAIQRLLEASVIQPKLMVSVPGDEYELEAERVAEAVMRVPNPVGEGVSVEHEHGIAAERIHRIAQRGSRGHRQPKQFTSPMHQDELQQTDSTSERPTVEGNLERKIRDLRGSGRPLPMSVQSYFEPRFGKDFSRVRIHDDQQAVETANAINARAYTIGRHIVFGSGEYAPEKRSGMKLLAHELTHVIHQTGGRDRQDSRQTQRSATLVESQTVHRQPWYKFWLKDYESKPDSLSVAINVDPDSTEEFDTGWQRGDLESALLAVATGLAVNTVGRALKLAKGVSEGLGLLVSGLTAYEGYQVEKRFWGETVEYHEWYGRYRLNILTGNLVAVDFQGTGDDKRTFASPYYYQERVADADGNAVYTHWRHELTIPGIEVREPEFPERSFGTFD